LTQLPQARQRSGMTMALPFSTRMAFTGQLRRQAQQSWHSLRAV